uniref:Uncharacterized protein n=1 Tax=Rhizophora mucronata TaxID=61149 RepID=A0A2P2P1P0_RHIMU
MESLIMQWIHFVASRKINVCSRQPPNHKLERKTDHVDTK